MTDLLAEQRRAVVAACSALVAGGLLRGTSGNVSVLDPSTGLVAMTPSAVPYAELTAEHVAVVTADGETVGGSLRPTSEAGLHLRIYRERPDVQAVVHTHSVFATTFAAMREPIPPVHYLLARAGRAVPIAPYARFGSDELAAGCATALGADHAVLLANHGVVAVGAVLGDAVAIAEAVETTAEIAWRARVAGRPVLLTDRQMSDAADAFATYRPTPRAGRPDPES